VAKKLSVFDSVKSPALGFINDNDNNVQTHKHINTQNDKNMNEQISMTASEQATKDNNAVVDKYIESQDQKTTSVVIDTPVSTQIIEDTNSQEAKSIGARIQELLAAEPPKPKSEKKRNTRKTPNSKNNVQLTVYVPPESIKQLKVLGAFYDRTTSDLVEEGINWVIKKYKK